MPILRSALNHGLSPEAILWLRRGRGSGGYGIPIWDVPIEPGGLLWAVIEKATYKV
jgi:hypothetical protein